MAGKKKTVPRQSRTTEPRAAKIAKPRWGEVIDGLERSIMRASPFLNSNAGVDPDKIYLAAKKYGGKKYGLELTDKDSAIIYRPSHIWRNPDGSMKPGSYDALKKLDAAQGKVTAFYDVPLTDPRENWIEKEKRVSARKNAIKRLTKAASTKPITTQEFTPHPSLPHVRYRSTYIETAGGRKLTEKKLVGSPPLDPNQRRNFKGNVRVFKTEGEAKIYSDEMKIKEMRLREKDRRTSELEKDTIRKQLRAIRDENTVLKMKHGAEPKTAARSKPLAVAKAASAPKRVVPKPASQPKLVTPRGSKHDGTPLSPSQYITRQGYVWTRSAKHRQEMEKAEARRQQRANKRAAQREYRAAIRASKHLAAMRRRRLKERLREPSRRLVKRMIVHAETIRKIRGVQRFAGRQPLPIALKNANWASRRAINKAMKSLPHSERYPAVGHGSASPMRPPVSMASVSGQMTLTAPRDGRRSGVAGTKAYATTQTVQGRGGSGTGIFFRINADAVIANLTQRYPQAMAAAAKGAAATMGRRLLDIVEPYVPKDTGLMYTTAQSMSDQTADGLVDIDGAEPYPSSEMFGVSISYNTPYAEDVYFDPDKAHGEAYNRKHNTSEKGEKETMRWIEVAYKEEGAAVQGLLGEYAQIITSAFDSLSTLQGGHMSPRRRNR